jgi:hypothetical protein
MGIIIASIKLISGSKMNLNDIDNELHQSNGFGKYFVYFASGTNS